MFTRIVAAAACAGLVAAGAPVPASAETTLHVRLGGPPDSRIGRSLSRFEKEVEALSDGAVTIEVDASSDGALAGALGGGDAAMAAVPVQRYADEVRAVEVFSLPFLIGTDRELLAAVAPGSDIRSGIEDAILKAGATVLWWQSRGGIQLIADGAPLGTPGDMAGRRVGVPDPVLGRWVEALGADPIPGRDPSYRSGKVDAVVTRMEGISSDGLWDATDSVTRLDVARSVVIVVVDRAVWEELGEEEQLWVNEAASRVEIAAREASAEAEARAWKEVEAMGLTVHEPTPAEMEAWRKASRPLVDAWLEEVDDLAQTAYEAARAL